jgi:hypothetical protein
MLARIWNWIKSFFMSEETGTVLKKLVENAKATVTEQLLDKENQDVAYKFVKELHNDATLTTVEKATKFNEKLLSWAKELGKVLSTSTINCLRELAVTAFKAEAELAEKDNK